MPKIYVNQEHLELERTDAPDWNLPYTKETYTNNIQAVFYNVPHRELCDLPEYQHARAISEALTDDEWDRVIARSLDIVRVLHHVLYWDLHGALSMDMTKADRDAAEVVCIYLAGALEGPLAPDNASLGSHDPSDLDEIERYEWGPIGGVEYRAVGDHPDNPTACILWD